jgi:hypothetical protein
MIRKVTLVSLLHGNDDVNKQAFGKLRVTIYRSYSSTHPASRLTSSWAKITLPTPDFVPEFQDGGLRHLTHVRMLDGGETGSQIQRYEFMI